MNPRFRFSHATLCLLAGAAMMASAPAQEVNLQWQGSGAQRKLGVYWPQRIKFSATKPAGLTRAPSDLTAPLYGEFKIGPKESPATVLVILDEPDGKPARLFLDSNGNGDLTDDAGAAWKERTGAGRGGKETKTFNGDATVKIPFAGGAKDAHLNLYRFDKADPDRAAFKDTLFYYYDYAFAGTVKLGDKSYPSALVDTLCTGDFRPAIGEGKPSVILWLDLNGDGRFDGRSESFDIKKPFNIGGTTWEVADMTAEGSFKLVKSSKTVEEIKPPPSLVKGNKAPSFKAKTTDGKAVNFPGDYKGKVLLLDFWATWCGPCVAEIPNVVKNYEKYHSQGFEVLGISLDRAGSEQKLAQFTKDKKMPWPQVFDGKGWESEIGHLYGIEAIPHMLLVDGETGVILAGSDVRGEKLGPSIEAGLKQKPAK